MAVQVHHPQSTKSEKVLPGPTHNIQMNVKQLARQIKVAKEQDRNLQLRSINSANIQHVENQTLSDINYPDQKQHLLQSKTQVFQFQAFSE